MDRSRARARRITLWTRDKGSIETLYIKGEYHDAYFCARELGPEMGCSLKPYVLTAREAKAFHKGTRKHRDKAKGEAGSTRDRSHRALKQSGGYVTSGWQNRRPNMRQSKAIINAATRALRD